MVPVDIAHHHVLGEHEAFKGGYSFFGDGEPFPFGVGDEGFNEPLNVDAAVGDVAVVRVAHQVVHFVGIERAADEFAEARFVVTLDERYDAFREILSNRRGEFRQWSVFLDVARK